MKLKTLLAVLATTLIAVPSSIYASNNAFNDAFQVGLGLGAGINVYSPAENYVSVRNAAHSSYAWSVYARQNFNRHFAIEFGYIHYGFYENDGNGKSICDINGNCGYSKVDIDLKDLKKSHFKTDLSINNEISNQTYYLASVWTLPLGNNLLYAKVGISYTLALIDSYVIVDPEVEGIGPTFNVSETIKNRKLFYPFLAAGWGYQLTPRTSVSLDFNWNSPVEMYRQSSDIYDGTLFPSAILMNIGYKL